jgi:hypothetical protein
MVRRHSLQRVAVLAACAQVLFVPDPDTNVRGYLACWTITAILAGILIGYEAVTRSRRIHSGLATEMIMQAIEHFLPAAIMGLLLTLVFLNYLPDNLWMLPGLWQLILSLGVFASCRSLPRPMVAVGAWYMVCGFLCLVLAAGENAFSPLAMGVPFAIGQWLAAALLQYSGGGHDEA